LLQTGLAAGVTLSAWPLSTPAPLWGEETGTPKRGGTLRVRGGDLPHFDPHLTINNYTNYVLSFIYGRLVRHKVGAAVQPGEQVRVHHPLGSPAATVTAVPFV
jgi:ABC-type oligopeptide transport system substrate-binding subunit